MLLYAMIFQAIIVDLHPALSVFPCGPKISVGPRIAADLLCSFPKADHTPCFAARPNSWLQAFLPNSKSLHNAFSSKEQWRFYVWAFFFWFTPPTFCHNTPFPSSTCQLSVDLGISKHSRIFTSILHAQQEHRHPTASIFGFNSQEISEREGFSAFPVFLVTKTSPVVNLHIHVYDEQTGEQDQRLIKRTQEVKKVWRKRPESRNQF